MSNAILAACLAAVLTGAAVVGLYETVLKDHQAHADGDLLARRSARPEHPSPERREAVPPPRQHPGVHPEVVDRLQDDIRALRDALEGSRDKNADLERRLATLEQHGVVSDSGEEGRASPLPPAQLESFIEDVVKKQSEQEQQARRERFDQQRKEWSENQKTAALEALKNYLNAPERVQVGLSEYQKGEITRVMNANHDAFAQHYAAIAQQRAQGIEIPEAQRDADEQRVRDAALSALKATVSPDQYTQMEKDLEGYNRQMRRSAALANGEGGMRAAFRGGFGEGGFNRGGGRGRGGNGGGGNNG